MMKKQWTDLLEQYLADHHPALCEVLQREKKWKAFLRERLGSLGDMPGLLREEGLAEEEIQQRCLALLLAEMRASRILYLARVLEEEFWSCYLDFRKGGLGTWDNWGLVKDCQPVFDRLGFTGEGGESGTLWQAIIETISNYLERHKNDLSH